VTDRRAPWLMARVWHALGPDPRGRALRLAGHPVTVGLSWADGVGMIGLPPQPNDNLRLVVASILEHKVPAGGIMRSVGQVRSWIIS
jgi:hypothetical protein